MGNTNGKLLAVLIAMLVAVSGMAQRGRNQQSQNIKAVGTLDRIDRLDRIKQNRDKAKLVKPTPFTLKTPAKKKSLSDSKKQSL